MKRLLVLVAVLSLLLSSLAALRLSASPLGPTYFVYNAIVETAPLATATATPTVTPSPTVTATPSPTATTTPIATGCRIYGTVTLGGQPVADVALSLNRFNSNFTITTMQTFTTTAEGTYDFRDLPPLEEPTAFYYVFYDNPTFTPGRLGSAATGRVQSCSVGEQIERATFDIADVELLGPPLGATVSLPVSLSWRPRPASPSDNYELFIYQDPCCSASTRINDLGYVDHYTLEALPPGFQTNTPTIWLLQISTPDGGYGEVRLGWTFRVAP